jgi:hypothetical protein
MVVPRRLADKPDSRLCATFDSDSFRDEELQGIVFDALVGIDPDWRAHLTLAE